MRTSLLTFLLLLVFTAEAKVYKWVDDNGRVHYSDKPPADEELAQELSIPDNNNLNHLQGITTEGPSSHQVALPNIKISVRSLLTQSKFAELEQMFATYHSEELRHSSGEYNLVNAYNAFDIEPNKLQNRFDQWVERYPDSAISHSARGSYYFYQGSRARGYKASKDTSEAQFSLMRTYFEKARVDLLKAIELDEKSVLPHYFLISIKKNNQDKAEVKAILNAALQKNPYSYIVRQSYMHSLEPRWGGSFDEMVQFANESQKYAVNNSKLKLLKGSVYLELGVILYRGKKYSEAEKLFTKGLEFGDGARGFYLRGKNYYFQQDYQKALADLAIAISLNSEDGDYYYWRSKIRVKLKRFNEALQDAQRAIALNPGEAKIVKHRNMLAEQIKVPEITPVADSRYDEEMRQLETAIQNDPRDSVNYFAKAKLFLTKNKNQDAVESLKIAIELKPDRFAYYHLMDYALFKQGKLNEILEFWQQYISLVPNDSRAYLERSGTYYHKNDYQSAKKDARKALDLGNLEAEVIYQKLVKMTE